MATWADIISTWLSDLEESWLIAEAQTLRETGQRDGPLATRIRQAVNARLAPWGNIPTDPERLAEFMRILELAKSVDVEKWKPEWVKTDRVIQAEVFEPPLTIQGHGEDIRITGFTYMVRESKIKWDPDAKGWHFMFIFHLQGNLRNPTFQSINRRYKSINLSWSGNRDQKRNIRHDQFLNRELEALSRDGNFVVWIYDPYFNGIPVPFSLWGDGQTSFDHLAPLSRKVIMDIFMHDAIHESIKDERIVGSVGWAGAKTRS